MKKILREQLVHYKKTVESLKALISVSTAASIPVNQIFSDNWESIEELQEYKDSIKEEILSEIMKSTNKPQDIMANPLRKPIHTPIATSKIVKHIRGGIYFFLQNFL